MMRRRHTGALLVSLALAGVLAVAAACGDDDDGDADREAAADLTATFENFKRDLQATANIEEAPDDVKDGLKDDCGDLEDGIDSDRIDEFCDDLEQAIDDEEQTGYEELQSRFSTDVEAPYRNEIAERIEDADDDAPLEGGDDPGDDD